MVGAYFPSFAGIILAICCFVVAGLQPVGFVGVLRVCHRPFPLLYPLFHLQSEEQRPPHLRWRLVIDEQEKTSTYRWYSLLNMLAVLSSFAAAAGLIISSATKHAPAIGKCRVSHFTFFKSSFDPFSPLPLHFHLCSNGAYFGDRE